jgi:hypothetical protein
MSDFVIYVIDVFEKKTEWTEYTKKSINKYAGRINADVNYVGAEYFKKVNFPKNFNRYSKIIFLKLVIMHEFLKTKYKRGLILDIDILISEDAKNIFEEKKSQDFYMEIDGFPAALKSAEWKIKNWLGYKNFNIKKKNEIKDGEKITEALPNAGVILFNGAAVRKIYNRIPEPIHWVNFFKNRYGFDKNFEDIYKRQITEQELILFLSYEFEECAPHKLGNQWNGGPFEGVFFLHLYKHKDFIKYFSSKNNKRSLDIIRLLINKKFII